LGLHGHLQGQTNARRTGGPWTGALGIVENQKRVEPLMIRMMFEGSERPFKRVLCLGAHSDDIEIGCGGTILRILKENNGIEALWIVMSADEKRAIEARSSAEKFLSGALRNEIRVEGFRDGFFPYEASQIKEYFEKLKTEFSPDVIFTPSREDLHQDHKLISELTWNTFRAHLILEYEVVKYDGDLGKPNVYFPLSEEVCSEKIEIILQTFKSQTRRSWFTEDAFRAIMRIRGIETNGELKHAEAFYGRKICI
jgi:LmbE family N-acetylglucosaminyl deacetylase